MLGNCIKKSDAFVYFAAFTANIFSGLAGIGYGWPSPFLPKLGSNDTSQNPLGRPTTLLEDSWIMSLQNLGALSGPLFVGTISSMLGHKKTLLLYAVPFFISSIMLIFPYHIWCFYIARFLLGISTGCALSLVPIYVAEISDVTNRGAVGCFLVMMMNGFLVIVYVIGPYISIRAVAVMSLGMTVIFVFVFGLFVPESPYYLVYKGKTKQSQKVLRRLRGRSMIDKDLQEIQEVVDATQKVVSFKSLIKSKLVRKCLIIGIGLSVLQQATAVVSIFGYMQKIFEMSNFSLFKTTTAVVFIGMSEVGTNMVIVKLISSFKRRTLLLVSYVANLGSLICLGLFFYFLERGDNLESISWFSFVGIAWFAISYAIGAGPLTFTLMGEIFPLNLKSYLSSISAFFNIFTGFIVGLIFPSLYTYIGMSWTLWIFGVLVLCGIIFIITVVPETKDKSFLEIQRMILGENCDENKEFHQDLGREVG